MRNPKGCLLPEEIESRLSQAGVQATIQRISIARYVLCEADHPTADDVHAWAEKNLAKISLATVYNTLNVLKEAGLIREYRFPHTEKAIYDNNLTHHFHFYDQGSGELYDIEPEDVKLSIEIPKKFEVKDVSILFTGKTKSLSKKVNT